MSSKINQVSYLDLNPSVTFEALYASKKGQIWAAETKNSELGSIKRPEHPEKTSFVDDHRILSMVKKKNAFQHPLR